MLWRCSIGIFFFATPNNRPAYCNMSSDDSSSEDDVPLAALAKKEESSDEVEFNGEHDLVDSNDDEPDTDDFIVEDEDEDDDEEDYASDSSEDAPLSALKTKKEKEKKKKKASKDKKAKAKAKPAKKSTSAKKAPPKKKATTATKKKKSATAKNKALKAAASINYVCASSELYAMCDKGKLIQSLLSRWWYAYEWPDPKDLPLQTPKGYDALDGFPGMYICTEGDDVGKFMDKRNHAKSPSFNNFAKKSSEELKNMLLTAITKQMKKLIENEGEGTDTEKGLKALEKWAMKLNCTKADKDAEKVLKAKRLKIS